MTEEQWLSCTDADELLTYLRGKKNNRKLRLFGCACYRRIWHLVPKYWSSSRSDTERFYKAVEISERFADKLVSAKDLDRARMETMASPVHVTARSRFFEQIELAAYDTRGVAGRLVIDPKDATPIRERLDRFGEMQEVDNKAQAAILHDLFGNPFRPVTIFPIWQTWNEATVVRLAQAVYEERILPAGTLDNTRLLILADALEEAGCTNEQILRHLRSGGEHYRGCFVLDTLLGKT